MPKQLIPVEQVLAILSDGPSHIVECTVDLESAQLHTPLNQDEWSANDVLAHLRSCADVWGGCMETIIAEDNPTFRAVDPRTWMANTNYPELAFRFSLNAFMDQRSRLLKLLDSLALKDWSRKATVTGAGKPLERTVHFYAQWLARHERTHVKQIKRIAETMRRDAKERD